MSPQKEVSAKSSMLVQKGKSGERKARDGLVWNVLRISETRWPGEDDCE